MIERERLDLRFNIFKYTTLQLKKNKISRFINKSLNVRIAVE